MTDPSQRVDADARTLITYAACTDACIAVLDADLLPNERDRLQRILDRLTDMGFVTLATVDTPPLRLRGIDDVIGHLRYVFGAIVVDAAVGAARYPASPIEPPHAIIPMSRFQADQSDGMNLTAIGRLFGYDILFEAFEAPDGDHSPSSVDRCHLGDWYDPNGAGRLIGAMRLPGWTEAYTVCAVTLAF